METNPVILQMLDHLIANPTSALRTGAGYASKGLGYASKAAGAAMLPWTLMGGAQDLHDATAPMAGLSIHQRLNAQRGGSMHDVMQRAFSEQRQAQGLPPIAGVEPQMSSQARINDAFGEVGAHPLGQTPPPGMGMIGGMAGQTAQGMTPPPNYAGLLGPGAAGAAQPPAPPPAPPDAMSAQSAQPSPADLMSFFKRNGLMQQDRDTGGYIDPRGAQASASPFRGLF